MRFSAARRKDRAVFPSGLNAFIHLCFPLFIDLLKTFSIFP